MIWFLLYCAVFIFVFFAVFCLHLWMVWLDLSRLTDFQKMFHIFCLFLQKPTKHDYGSRKKKKNSLHVTRAGWAWHSIRVQPGCTQLVWMSYLSQCFVRKLTSCEFAAEASIWPQLSGDDSLAERELAGAAALLWRQMLRASPRLSGDHHCFLWAPLCLVLWSVPLITACLPAFSTQAAKALIKFESPSYCSRAHQLGVFSDWIIPVNNSAPVWCRESKVYHFRLAIGLLYNF